MVLGITLGACQTEPKTIEKEVILEVSKNLDVQVLKSQYDLHARLFSKNLADISDKEANQRINNSNSLTWIVGHTLDIQYNLAALLGLEVENKYAEQFAFGKPFDPNADYPSLSKMIADWDALSLQISAAFEKLKEEQLNASSPFPLPMSEQTFRGLFAFQMHHLAYEFGQIGLYRKYLGKKPFSYQ